MAGTDWERPSAGRGGKTSSGPWDAGGWPAVVAMVVVVRWPAEPMQQEVKDWKGEGVVLSPYPHAIGKGVRPGAWGVPHLVEGRKAELRRLPQVPISVDADDVLAKGPSASNVDNVNAVLGGQGEGVRHPSVPVAPPSMGTQEWG